MEYGEQRLVSILDAGADTSPASMLGRTMADLDLFVGNAPQHDDITCLMIKATSGLDTTDHPVRPSHVQ
jgi:serine phosphatase RsbU (regulator of sigma subunit)